MLMHRPQTPQPGFGSITFISKIHPHFKILDPRLGLRVTVQYVAQYPDGTSIRTPETKTQFLRRPFQFLVNEVFRMKAEHFSFKMKVLAL